MADLNILDMSIILAFLGGVILIGLIASRSQGKDSESYLLSGRKVGILLFIMTTVSTWYGGILGVGEFTYRYGIMNWFTQGLPYYIFAILFALLLAKKIRVSGLFTIPDKIETAYGKFPALIASVLVFILVSPAPYILMFGTIISMVFNIPLFWSMVLGIIFTIPYLIIGGYKADLYTDVFEFFIMFIGFAIVIIIAVKSFGSIPDMLNRLPASHLSITGGTSASYLIVWYLIALWTFVDPGFHQRCYAAKTPEIARKGILISVILWFVFDVLTTLTGLYARAYLPDITNPLMAFPLLANRLIMPGIKGIFYAAMLATILSTLNSFIFLSAGTFSRDMIQRLRINRDRANIRILTAIGVIITSVIALILAYYYPSVVELWYIIGSICIPGLLMPVLSAYFIRIRVSNIIISIEMITSIIFSIIWHVMRINIIGNVLLDTVEPMIAGLGISLCIHFIYLLKINIIKHIN